jgi:hypothetical protein
MRLTSPFSACRTRRRFGAPSYQELIRSKRQVVPAGSSEPSATSGVVPGQPALGKGLNQTARHV